MDSIQAATCEDRWTVTNLRKQLEQLTDNMTDMEDMSRRNKVCRVGLPEGADAAGFLRANLSKWMPSLKDRNIEIDRACMMEEEATLIGCVLSSSVYWDGMPGQKAYPVKLMQDNVSQITTDKRKSFNPILKKMMDLGLQPFLIYPVAIKLWHKGEQLMFKKRRILSIHCQRRYAAAL